MTAWSTMLLTGMDAGNTAISQHQQAGAVMASGAYNRRLAEFNAQQADRDADLTAAAGQRASNRQRVATRQTIGAQRAAFAAQGVDVGSGSALDVQADTAELGELDAATIANEAARAALGYRAQAADSRQRGILAGLEARNQAMALKRAARGTLVKGAADVYATAKRRKDID